MISRRLLRTKTLQIVYAYFQADDPSLNQFEKELFHSINKSYELYHYIFQLIIDVSEYSLSRIELAKTKLIPTEDDVNPNNRFVENKIIQQLKENDQLQHYLSFNKLSWVNNPELVRKIFLEFADTDDYKLYMNERKGSYTQDRELINCLVKNVIYNCEDLVHTLEEQSIYWLDDFDFMVSMVAKTISEFKIGDTQERPLMPLFKNSDDSEFVKRLFRKVILNHVEYKGIIESHIKNWDLERIAFIDTLIMMLAIAEIIEFPSIPIKVTFDEYIEIAKKYSTEKSNLFINGILDKVVATLNEKGKINKQGRGLISIGRNDKSTDNSPIE